MRKTASTVPRIALYTLLASWAGCTVTRQIDPTFRPIHHLEKMGITVPNYRFFGPRPGVHDTHLLIRCHLNDGRTEPWRELVLREDRRLIHMLWAPHRRMDKGVADALAELLIVIRVTQDIRRISRIIPYRALLNVALFGVEHSPDAWATQFAIGRSAVFDASVSPRIIFTSDVHQLETAPPRRGAPMSPVPKSSVEV
ncbi:MAG TPA: hypothetical protein VJT49_12515 [Amycolatopsis sp.]|uniref:hypothetical protein n=1 Tax=Amycolatopsis sp. TaxID=37632 RepID=UPI002B48093A|nr:hypothetical protein [Amycolatopsis sp.]HKS45911.1 hypothetical protein [Amycolatopsis sp.]